MRRSLHSRYIWQESDWPNWRYDSSRLLDLLGEAKQKQGELRGLLATTGFEERKEAQLEALTEDALKTSEIEGEHLDPNSVRSSVARRLGLAEGGLRPEDPKVEGIVEITLDATQNYVQPLTESRLFNWHTLIFPVQRGKDSGLPRVIGAWRDDGDGPMQVRSGPIGRERIHFEAPGAAHVPQEMSRFLTWFAAPQKDNGILRAAIAHLWFVTIHPFEDGNGRIARAVADMALSQEEGSQTRFFSMTRQINAEKSSYYDILEQTQSSSLEITPWLQWFLSCYAHAIEHAMVAIREVLKASKFWTRFARVTFSERQRKVLTRFLGRLEGNLTVQRWARLAKTSHDTANRDIADLVQKGVLIKSPGGARKTRYEIAAL